MTRKEQNKISDDKIESNINQYKVDRLNAEISAFSSGDLNKYEFLKRIDLNYKPNALDKARFEFSPLGRAFNEGLDKTIPNYQEEGVIKLLKEITDNLPGGVNIPAGLIIPPGPPGPLGPQGPPGPQGSQGLPQTPLSSLSSSSDSSSDLTSVTPITPPPAPRTTINTQMPLPPIITTISTPSRIPIPISTPVSTSISTPSRISSRIPISTSIQSRIPIPIIHPLDEGKGRTPFNIKNEVQIHLIV